MKIGDLAPRYEMSSRSDIQPIADRDLAMIHAAAADENKTTARDLRDFLERGGGVLMQAIGDGDPRNGGINGELVLS